jgi:hypothetical protein
MMLKLKAKADPKARRPVLLERMFEKRRKGLVFEPEAKTYRWIAPRER